jgi:hypothetical protein
MSRAHHDSPTRLLPVTGTSDQAAGEQALPPAPGGNGKGLPPAPALLPPPPGGSVRAVPIREEPNESEALSPTPLSPSSTPSANAPVGRPGGGECEWEGRARALLGAYAEAVCADSDDPLGCAEGDLREAVRGTHGGNDWQLAYRHLSALLDMGRQYRATPAPASRVSDRMPWWIHRRSFYLEKDVTDIHPWWILHGDDPESPDGYEPGHRGRKHPGVGWLDAHTRQPLNTFEGTQEELWERFPGLLDGQPPAAAPAAAPSRRTGRIVRRSKAASR